MRYSSLTYLYLVRSSLVHSPAYNDLAFVLMFFEYYNTKSTDILKSCFNVEEHRLYILKRICLKISQIFQAIFTAG
jgi:hypothetical protein